MVGEILNCFEESPIKNGKLPQQWRDQSALDEFATFLQHNWEQRSVFFDDGEISSRQHFIGFTGQKGIRTNNYIGTVVFKGQQINIFPKVFREERHDNDTDQLELKHLMKNLVQWIQYCTRVEYGQAKVRFQASELTLVSDVVYDGQSLGKAFTMRHDILVEHKDHGLFILDTKYKHMSRFEGNEDVKKSVTDEVSQSDLYQMIEYAAHRDIDTAYLLYPMYRFEETEPKDVVLERTSVSGKKIYIHVVRLPFVFEDDAERIKQNLTATIQGIFSKT